jgi:hypothetical protein
MIDVISLSIAIGAIIVGILSHIRHSECYGIKIDTRSAKNTPPTTPSILETQPLLQDTPAILQPSEPIDISNKRKIIKNWL